MKFYLSKVNPNKVGNFGGRFFWGYVSVWTLPPLHILRRNDPNSMQLCTIVKRPIWSKLKLKICRHHLLYDDFISFLEQGNANKLYELTKIVKIGEKNLHIFWRTWWISMKFLGNNKGHKKTPEFHPFSRKYILGRIIWGETHPSSQTFQD